MLWFSKDIVPKTTTFIDWSIIDWSRRFCVKVRSLFRIALKDLVWVLYSWIKDKHLSIMDSALLGFIHYSAWKFVIYSPIQYSNLVLYCYQTIERDLYKKNKIIGFLYRKGLLSHWNIFKNNNTLTFKNIKVIQRCPVDNIFKHF